jgi:hypothetical protein
MESPGRDALRAGQDELLRAFFTEDMAEDFLRRRAAGGDDGFDVVFHLGQFLALQKLAVAICRPGPGTSFEEGTRLGQFVLAAAQVNEVRDQLGAVPADDMDIVDAALYAFRASELSRIAFPSVVAGRAFRMWLESSVPWPAGLEHPDDYCRRAFSVSLPTFVAVGAAPALGRLKVELEDLSSVPFDPDVYFRDTTVEPEVARRVLDPLVYGVPVPGPAMVRSPATYWCFFDLAGRPLVPYGNGLVVPCSVRYSLERATTGIFWMLDSTSEDSGPLRTHFGRMFEQYCLEMTRPLASTRLTVSGELSYGPAAARRKTCDTVMTGIPRTGAALPSSSNVGRCALSPRCSRRDPGRTSSTTWTSSNESSANSTG